MGEGLNLDESLVHREQGSGLVASADRARRASVSLACRVQMGILRNEGRDMDGIFKDIGSDRAPTSDESLTRSASRRVSRAPRAGIVPVAARKMAQIQPDIHTCPWHAGSGVSVLAPSSVSPLRPCNLKQHVVRSWLHETT